MALENMSTSRSYSGDLMSLMQNPTSFAFTSEATISMIGGSMTPDVVRIGVPSVNIKMQR